MLKCYMSIWSLVGILAVACAVWADSEATAAGTSYYVSLDGDDTRDGLSRDAAFATVQRGVDALSPGDELVIAAGEYLESVARKDLGGPDADTVIRAEIPGTVVLRGDVPVSGFERVTGWRFVYAADFDREPLTVLEPGTLKSFGRKENIAAVEFDPGTFYYDQDAGRLYLSSSDLTDPGSRLYTASIVSRGDAGLNLEQPVRVVIDGLGATGHDIGINLVRAESCVVRNCATWLNLRIGINLSRAGRPAAGRGNTVENCRSYGQAHNIHLHPADDIIRNNYVYRGGRGIRTYAPSTGGTMFSGNIGWGNTVQDLELKVDRPGNKVENCVWVGAGSGTHTSGTLIGGANFIQQVVANMDPSLDDIRFLFEDDLDLDREFADPENLDFRLQADSRFRGTGPDGSDRGPYPYRANIFYLRPGGDDAYDGLTAERAWGTLARAVTGLRPGDTLYLEGGLHAGGFRLAGGEPGEPIRIRGRGTDPAVIDGRVEISGAADIVFERLNFTDTVTVDNSRAVAFNNCTFSGGTAGLLARLFRTRPAVHARLTDDLRINHGLFAERLVLDECSGVYLSGNVFAGRRTPAVIVDRPGAIVYADYNGYRDGNACWSAGGRAFSLARLRETAGRERYSVVLDPVISRFRGALRLADRAFLAGRGPGGTALGPYREMDREELQMAGPFVHSVSDTTANIEWWTSAPTDYEIAWGETPAMENRTAFTMRRSQHRYNSFSLTGLTPGTGYYFQLRKGTPPEATDDFFLKRATVSESRPVSFRTAASAAEPLVYYVAPDGDDANNGLSRASALRTVSRAASLVNAGDTVMIAEGAYREEVLVRATGDEERPVTFRSIPFEKVVFHGGGVLSRPFRLPAKHHVHLDGFYINEMTGFGGGAIELYRSDHVRITRVFIHGWGVEYSPGLVNARESADLLLKNNVVLATSGAQLRLCPGARLENNVLISNYINQLLMTNQHDQKFYLKSNIVGDNLPNKLWAGFLEIARVESLVEDNNCFYLRVPDEERSMFLFYAGESWARLVRGGEFRDVPEEVLEEVALGRGARLGLAGYHDRFGASTSFVGNPMFSFAVELGIDYEALGRDGRQVYLGARRGVCEDFPAWFATDPKVVERGIGLEPEAFADFHFNRPEPENGSP